MSNHERHEIDEKWRNDDRHEKQPLPDKLRMPAAPANAEIIQGRISQNLLNQDAVPTLVEVKRSTDTRIRREAIGQMLDYAAKAVAYWPDEEVRAKFESDGGNSLKSRRSASNRFTARSSESVVFVSTRQ